MRQGAAAPRLLVVVMAHRVVMVVAHHVVVRHVMAMTSAPHHVVVMSPTPSADHAAMVVTRMPARRIVLGPRHRSGGERKSGDGDKQTDHGRIPPWDCPVNLEQASPVP